MIIQQSPSINIQYDNFNQVLKLQSHRTINRRNSINYHQNNNIDSNTNNSNLGINLHNASSVIPSNQIQSSIHHIQSTPTNDMRVHNDEISQHSFTENNVTLLNTSVLSDISDPPFASTYNNPNISPMINNRINTLIESVRRQNLSSPINHAHPPLSMTLRSHRTSTANTFSLD